MFRQLVRRLCTREGPRKSHAGGRRLPGANDPKDVLKMLKDEFSGKTLKEMLPCPREVDVLIIGGGIMGSSIAYWLKQNHPLGSSVAVIEKDFTYSKASTCLSVGGIRQQFSSPENIQMSMFTAEFLRKHQQHLAVEGEDSPPDVQFHPNGYLVIANQDNADKLLKMFELQRDMGAHVKLFTAEQLKNKFPFINTEDVQVASYGTQNEGWFDGWSLLQGLKRRAAAWGADFVKGDVIGFEFDDTPVVVDDKRYRIPSPRQALVQLPNGDIQPVRFAICVICAGPWAGDIAQMMGIGDPESPIPEVTVPLPVEPRKRFVYMTHCPDGPGLEMPFVIDSSQAYTRREGLGNHYIMGKCPKEDEESSIDNLDVDYDFYNENVWPPLAHRIPSMENQKVISAWAGYYDYNYLDQNLIIGNHPFFRQIMFANGSSGHGLQHSIAIGRAIMEKIVYQRYKTIDLSSLEFERFLGNYVPDAEQAIY